MKLTSKVFTIPTVLILGAVLMVGMKVNKAGKKPDWSHQVLLVVTFTPSPRVEPLYVDWFALPEFRNDILVTHSRWEKYLIVKPGTLVKLMATQLTPGRLTCSITRNGIVASIKTTHAVGKVECETLVQQTAF
jgi:hypothetical protein